MNHVVAQVYGLPVTYNGMKCEILSTYQEEEADLKVLDGDLKGEIFLYVPFKQITLPNIRL